MKTKSELPEGRFVRCDNCLHFRDDYCPVFMQPVSSRVAVWCARLNYGLIKCYCREPLDIRKSHKAGNRYVCRCDCGITHMFSWVEFREPSPGCKSCLECGKFRECQRKKPKTLRACAATAERYRNPHRKKFFLPDSCMICKIHRKNNNCTGCFMAKPPSNLTQLNAGCTETRYYEKTVEKFYKVAKKSKSKLFWENTFPSKKEHPGVPEEFVKRAQFHERIVIPLDRYPPGRFTRRGEPLGLSEKL